MGIFYMSSVKNKSKSKASKASKSLSNQDKGGGGLHADHILNSLRNKVQKPQKSLSPQKGVPKGWRKVTTLMRDEHHVKLQELSHRERVQIKHILEEVLARFLSSVSD